MSNMVWISKNDMVLPMPTGWAWLRVLRRGIPFALVTFGGLALMLILRLIERPLFGAKRPLTPYLTQFVCRSAFVILGMSHSVKGTPMRGGGAAVANHSSWLDIFALNARNNFYFVAKSEVATWPAISWLAKATGTIFIRRDRSQAAAQTEVFTDRLRHGHQLLFFPEGTSTDGRRVLPFRSTLFQSFFADDLKNTMQIQPVSVSYFAPDGQDARFYGWWSDMDFAPNLLCMLGVARHGRVTITYHPPVHVKDYANRKTLALDLEQRVRAGHAPSTV